MPVKMKRTVQINRIKVESIAKNSPIPPHTPAMRRSDLERYSFFIYPIVAKLS